MDCCSVSITVGVWLSVVSERKTGLLLRKVKVIMNTIQIGNIGNLDALLEFYFAHEKQLVEESYEGYKWSILDKVHATLEDYQGKHFKEGKWDDDYQDFPDLVKTSAYDGGNLLYSNAKSVIRYVADFYPRELREMFINLYNESINIDDRINNRTS